MTAPFNEGSLWERIVFLKNNQKSCDSNSEKFWSVMEHIKIDFGKFRILNDSRNDIQSSKELCHVLIGSLPRQSTSSTHNVVSIDADLVVIQNRRRLVVNDYQLSDLLESFCKSILKVINSSSLSKTAYNPYLSLSSLDPPLRKVCQLRSGIAKKFLVGCLHRPSGTTDRLALSCLPPRGLWAITVSDTSTGTYCLHWQWSTKGVDGTHRVRIPLTEKSDGRSARKKRSENNCIPTCHTYRTAYRPIKLQTFVEIQNWSGHSYIWFKVIVVIADVVVVQKLMWNVAFAAYEQRYEHVANRFGPFCEYVRGGMIIEELDDVIRINIYNMWGNGEFWRATSRRRRHRSAVVVGVLVAGEERSDH